MTGVFPLIPNFSFPSVDVRDVAAAHIRAALDTKITGRNICIENTYSLKQITFMCKEAGFANVSSQGAGRRDVILFVACEQYSLIPSHSDLSELALNVCSCSNASSLYRI